jgi:hypothetical protein
MANTVQILRHMHLNGWFTVSDIARDLDLDPVTLERQLDQMTDANLLIVKNSTEIKSYRINKELPTVDVRSVVTHKSEFLEVARFYLELIDTLTAKAEEFDKSLGNAMKQELGRVNGWKDPKARAVVSSFNPAKGTESTLGNLERMMHEGVLLEEDIPILKKVMLCFLSALILKIESRADATISRLLFRLASCHCIEDARDLVAGKSLLTGIPETYLKQI